MKKAFVKYIDTMEAALDEGSLRGLIAFFTLAIPFLLFVVFSVVVGLMVGVYLITELSVVVWFILLAGLAAGLAFNAALYFKKD